MRIPYATYRLQFGQDFDFRKAADAAGYLSDLGIDTIYASPVFESLDSGYDITDPLKVSASLGGYSGLKKLSSRIKELDMLYLQDIVPNHMAYNEKNKLIADLFKKGDSSRYHNYFDIDWNHCSRPLKGKVLAPFLDTAHHKAYMQKKVRLCWGPDGFYLDYCGLSFPLKDGSYEAVLGKSSPVDTKGHSGPQKLYRLYKKDPNIKKYIDERIEKINNDRHEYFDLMERQVFRLTYWKVANEQINYRRFFTINHLICTSTQKEEVFLYLHQGIKKMVADGIADGVRVDHIDGLYNPLKYLKRLKRYLGIPFIIVEKILAADEELPKEWPVWGTTGYDFLNQLNAVFCKAGSQKNFDRIYHRFIGEKFDLDRLLYTKKKLVVDRQMQGDVENLANLLLRSERMKNEETTLASLKKAITCLLASYPVYRTYAGLKASGQDKKYIQAAAKVASYHEPELEYELSMLQEILSGTSNKKFRMKFQQYTGPVAAKGFEDTFLYNFNRLLSLNEVGSDPKIFGISLKKYYDFCAQRAKKWPNSLNATSTHDTKRGEDARARLNVLSEVPGLWEKKLSRWRKLNKNKKAIEGCPDKNDEYFLYQAMLGSYNGPISDFKKRMEVYIIKAIREAKVHTAWIKPDDRYEKGFLDFFIKVLGDDVFMDDFSQFVSKISFWQSLNTLSQTLIKITSPGIPDFYQGTELQDYSLVDPDNRKKIDYQKRALLLKKITSEENSRDFFHNMLAGLGDGTAKMFLTKKALQARRENIDNFQTGDFKPFSVSGKFKENIIAFGRTLSQRCLVTLAPRFYSQLSEEGRIPLGMAIYKDTQIHLPFRNAKNLLTGKETQSNLAGEILSDFPVALLLGEEAEGG